jgi:proteasome lid subunit RPN8/RPN11
VLIRYPLINQAASPREFLSEPRSMFHAEKDRRRRGLEFLAVYHSHPTSPPAPSRKDREANYSPEVVNLILSLAGPEPTARAWWIDGDTVAEAEWEIDTR